MGQKSVATDPLTEALRDNLGPDMENLRLKHRRSNEGTHVHAGLSR
jgi:hypothetical protein